MTKAGVDATSCAAAIKASDLRGCHTWVFQPDRTHQVAEYDNKNVDFFKASYTEVVDVEIGGKVYKGLKSRDYGLGEWTFVSDEDLEACWGEGGVIMPRCKSDGGVEEVDERDRKKPMLKKGDYKKRNNEKQKTKAQKKADSITEKDATLVGEQKDAGIFPCERKHDDGRRCTKKYSTLFGLRNHNFDGEGELRGIEKCKFPTLCLQDRVVSIASNVEMCLDLDSRTRVHTNANVSFEAVPQDQIKDSVPGFNHIFTSTNVGQYRKDISNKTRMKWTSAHCEFLQKQYNIGVVTPSQRQPLSVVYEAMRTVRMKDTGRFVFNRREGNTAGHVMDVGRMKQYFSQRKAQQGRNFIHPREAYWRACSAIELRRHVGGDTTGKKKRVLAKIMAERDKAKAVGGVYIVGFVDGAYIETPDL